MADSELIRELYAALLKLFALAVMPENYTDSERDAVLDQARTALENTKGARK